MFNWIHHLLEPHCPECKQEAEESKVCQSCEVLRVQLEIANFERKQLLQTVVDLARPNQESTPAEREISPEALKPKAIPWLVKRQMLEEEDRVKAKVMNDNRKMQTDSISNLEKELGVN